MQYVQNVVWHCLADKQQLCRFWRICCSVAVSTVTSQLDGPWFEFQLGPLCGVCMFSDLQPRPTAQKHAC